MRVCVCVSECVRVCDMPGLMSSGVINRTVKWPRVLPSALLPPLRTLELVELITSRPIVGLQEFSCGCLCRRTNLSSENSNTNYLKHSF